MQLNGTETFMVQKRHTVKALKKVNQHDRCTIVQVAWSSMTCHPLLIIFTSNIQRTRS